MRAVSAAEPERSPAERREALKDVFAQARACTRCPELAATRKTVVFVTHQIDEAVFLSDRVIVLTVRPGRVKEEIAIDLPRPRSLELKRTAEFVRYTDHIWRLIEQEVRDGIGLERQYAATLRARA